MQAAKTSRLSQAAGASHHNRTSVVVRAAAEEEGGRRMPGRFSRRPREERVEAKAFLDLPKPAHLVYIKPTVAVVAGVAARNSVGLKMTIGETRLERFVVEYYSKKL